MQATTRFHDGITHPVLQEADCVFHPPVAFHPTHGVFNADADGGNTTIGRFLRGREFPATRCFLGLDDRDPRQKDSLETLILIQATAGWQGIPGELRHAFIRRVAFIRVAQEGNVTGLLDHEEVFERVTLLLATVLFFLLLRIFRTLDRSFGPVLHKRGEATAASVSCRVNIAANSSAVRAGRRCWSAKAWFNTGCNR